MQPIIRKTYTEKTEQNRRDELRELAGHHKWFPAGYDLQALVALSLYPELHNIAIEFRFVKSDIPLHTTVKPSTFYLPAHKRCYLVNISTEIKKEREPLLLQNLPFNMQIGVLAHELAHVADYVSKSSLQLVTTAIFNPFKSHRQMLERTMDIETIHHGAGYQLLDFSQYVSLLRPQKLQDEYYHSYFDFHLTPRELATCMKGVEGYEEKKEHVEARAMAYSFVGDGV